MTPFNKQIKTVLEQYERQAAEYNYPQYRIDDDLVEWAGHISQERIGWVDINWTLEWESGNEYRFLFTAMDDNNRYFVDMVFDHLPKVPQESMDDAYDRAMKGI